MKILDLPLKKEWFKMIESGEKTEEYRQIKSYWIERLTWHEPGPDPNMIDPQRSPKPDTHIRFRHGYTKRTMHFGLESIRIGKGKPEWGAPAEKSVFILKLGNRIDSPWLH